MEITTRLTEIWSERAPRERRVLAAAGALLAAVLLYFMLVDPAVTGVARLHRALPQARQRLAELDGLLAEAKDLRDVRAAAAPRAADARTAVVKSLDSAGLAPTHNDATASGDMRLTFANVPYSKWSVWLATAEQTIGVHAVSVHLKSSGTPGNADIELALRLPRD